MNIVVLFLILYIYINNPFFNFWGGYSSHIILLPLIGFYIFSECRVLLFRNHKLVMGYSLILIYVLLRTLFGGDDSILILFLQQFVSNILYAVVLLYLFKKTRLDIRLFIYYVGIASVISTIACLIIPSFGEYVRNVLLHIPDEATSSYLEKNIFRGFGIANGLTFDYGLILGIIYSYCLYLGFDKKWHFLILLPFLLISILVNARTGFLVFLVSTIIYYLHYNNGNLKKLWVELVLVIIIGSFIIGSLNEDTKQFVSVFFDELLFQNEGKSTFDALIGRMIVLPTSLCEWFFGSGHSIFGSDTSSDIGFILQLNYGGILFVFILLFVYIIMLKMFHSKYLVLFSIFLLIIANFKGNFLFNSACYRLITFIAIIEYYNNYLSADVKK